MEKVEEIRIKKITRYKDGLLTEKKYTPRHIIFKNCLNFKKIKQI